MHQFQFLHHLTNISSYKKAASVKWQQTLHLPKTQAAQIWDGKFLFFFPFQLRQSFDFQIPCNAPYKVAISSKLTKQKDVPQNIHK